MGEYNIADIIAKRSKQLGLNLSQVAEGVGVSRQTIHKWINGNTNHIKKDHIEKLCYVLKLTVPQLLGLEEIDFGTTPTVDNRTSKVTNYNKLLEDTLAKIKSFDDIELYQLSLIVDTFIQMRFIKK